MDLSPDVSRELVSAYTDAAERGDDEDRAYAYAQIEDFIGDTDDDTPDEVLLPLLDLPLDDLTLPLLSSVSAMLRRRGPGVVEALLVTAVGEGLPPLGVGDVVGVAGAVGALLEAATRSPGSSPRVENALSVLDALPLGDLILGLIEVLEGRRDEHVKQVASEMLVDIGEDALDELTMAARGDDPESWAADTLVELKDRLGDPGDDDDRDVDDRDGDRDGDEDGDDQDGSDGGEAVGQDEDVAEGTGDDPAAGPVGDEPVDGSPDVGDGPAVDASGDDPAAGPPPIVGPDPGRLDADFDAFQRRFDEETGRR